MSRKNKPILPQCTGCGECCKAEPCPVGQMLFGKIIPCPGIIFLGNRHWCALVIAEALSPLEKLIAHALGVGKGCTNQNKLKQMMIETRIDSQLLELLEAKP
jgi:hypothetical protein